MVHSGKLHQHFCGMLSMIVAAVTAHHKVCVFIERLNGGYLAIYSCLNKHFSLTRCMRRQTSMDVAIECAQTSLSILRTDAGPLDVLLM